VPATTANRTAVKARIVALLAERAGLAGIQVTHGWPGKDFKGETIYLDQVRGRQEPAALRAGRKPRSDTFSVLVRIVAGQRSQKTPAIAEARASELLAELEDLLATNPTLADEDGPVPGLTHAVLGQLDGPDAEPTTEGWVAFVDAQVDCLARLA
jgi:hypothetical protein